MLGCFGQYHLLWATAFQDSDLIKESEISANFSSFLVHCESRLSERKVEALTAWHYSQEWPWVCHVHRGPGWSVRYSIPLTSNPLQPQNVAKRGVFSPLIKAGGKRMSSLQLPTIIHLFCWLYSSEKKKPSGRTIFFLKNQKERKGFRYFIRIWNSSFSLGSISGNTQEFCSTAYFKEEQKQPCSAGAISTMTEVEDLKLQTVKSCSICPQQRGKLSNFGQESFEQSFQSFSLLFPNVTIM